MKEVTKYEDNKGKIHDTKEKAEEADLISHWQNIALRYDTYNEFIEHLIKNYDIIPKNKKK